MNICWISDSPESPSGFGNVTRFICGGLARKGHRVDIIGWQTTELHEWEGCTVHPTRGMLGADALFPVLVRRRPDIVIALADVWWLPYFNAPHIRRQMEMIGAPWALYFPIDGETEDGRLPESWIELLEAVDVPVAMSRYGQAVVARCGIEAHYIPHGVDLEIFRPPEDREAAKQRVDAEGKFLVLSDSRNQPRKMIPRLLDAFGVFAAGRDDVLLHLHTDPEDAFAFTPTYAYRVVEDVRALGLEAKVRFTPGMVMREGGGIPLETLAGYYQAADVHLLASSGEGFGLPTLQAAAAGAVPMAGDYSASSELVRGHGEAIAIEGWTRNEFGIGRALIDVDDAAAKLARLHDDPGLLRERSSASRGFAEAYGWPARVDEWEALIRSVVSRKTAILRRPASVTQDQARGVLAALGQIPGGAGVQVNMVAREFGRLEAAIAGDSRGNPSDVRIPIQPKPAVIGGLKAMRRTGQIGVERASLPIFRALNLLFPILSAWVPAEDEGLGGVPPEGVEITWAGERPSSELRLHVAQSVLLLDLEGRLAEAVLDDAARLGAACIGPVGSAAGKYWPELQAKDHPDAVLIGRTFLTDAAFAASVIEAGQSRAKKGIDESQFADDLRRLSHAEATIAVS